MESSIEHSNRETSAASSGGEPNRLRSLLLTLLNRFLLMELSRYLLMEPISKGLLKEPTTLPTGCSLESFRLNRGFSVRGNNDLDFHAPTP
jgi:hypothetical protein